MTLAEQSTTFNKNLDEQKHTLRTIDLSPRELQILQLVSDGLTVKEIGIKLSLSEKTVANHCQNMRAKFGVNKTTIVAKEALKKGLIQ